jgi:hypothetical protein
MRRYQKEITVQAERDCNWGARFTSVMAADGLSLARIHKLSRQCCTS